MVDVEYFFKISLLATISPSLLLGETDTLLKRTIDFFTNQGISTADQVILIPEENSISIEQIKNAVNQSMRVPFNSPARALIINRANAMTLPAQNAFLKSLEEPSRQTNIVLISQNVDGLLATILSRLEIYKMKKIREPRYLKDIPQIMEMSLGDRMFYAQENYKKIEDMQEFLDALLMYCAADLSRLHNSVNLVNKIYNSKRALKSNVSEKLILEYIFTK